MAIDLKTGKKITIEGRNFGEDEPIFIMRARDPLGRDSVEDYGKKARLLNIVGALNNEGDEMVSEEFIVSCEEAGEKMIEWAEANDSRMPD